jgi:hypothetical protein
LRSNFVYFGFETEGPPSARFRERERERETRRERGWKRKGRGGEEEGVYHIGAEAP